jgi:hypothetical protein
MAKNGFCRWLRSDDRPCTIQEEEQQAARATDYLFIGVISETVGLFPWIMSKINGIDCLPRIFYDV